MADEVQAGAKQSCSASRSSDGSGSLSLNLQVVRLSDVPSGIIEDILSYLPQQAPTAFARRAFSLCS